MRRLVVFSLLFFGMLVSAHACKLEDADRLRLDTDISTFSGQLASGKLEKMLEWVPPQIFVTLAKKAGIDAATLRKTVATNLRTAMADAELVSFRMELDESECKSLLDGSEYVLLPTESIWKIKGDRFRANNHTVALVLSGKWHFVRLDSSSQRNILIEVFPKFANEQFAIGSMVKIDE